MFESLLENLSFSLDKPAFSTRLASISVLIALCEKESQISQTLFVGKH